MFKKKNEQGIFGYFIENFSMVFGARSSGARLCTRICIAYTRLCTCSTRAYRRHDDVMCVLNEMAARLGFSVSRKYYNTIRKGPPATDRAFICLLYLSSDIESDGFRSRLLRIDGIRRRYYHNIIRKRGTRFDLLRADCRRRAVARRRLRRFFTAPIESRARQFDKLSPSRVPLPRCVHAIYIIVRTYTRMHTYTHIHRLTHTHVHTYTHARSHTLYCIRDVLDDCRVYI